MVGRTGVDVVWAHVVLKLKLNGLDHLAKGCFRPAMCEFGLGYLEFMKWILIKSRLFTDQRVSVTDWGPHKYTYNKPIPGLGPTVDQ